MNERGCSIQVNNLTKSFWFNGLEIPVLKGIDLKVMPGEMISVIGASGVGKTTFLLILGTLESPTNGKIFLDELEVYQLNRDELNRLRNNKIGFIFQFHHLLPEFSALENVMIPALIARQDAKIARKRAEEILDRIGLGNRLHHKPSRLSGGEQQRVAVARALMNRPGLILADEPTGNLDFETALTVQKLLREINREQGITFVIATHNLQLARMTDRIMQIVDGKLIEYKDKLETSQL